MTGPLKGARMSNTTAQHAASGREMESERREKAMTLIHQRAHDPNFSVAAVAEELHLSLRQLYRSFAGYVSPTELISRRRTASAVALMLADPKMPVGAITVAAGFSDPTTLRDHLHRYTGMGPRQLRLIIRTRGPRHLRFTPSTVSTVMRQSETTWVPVAEATPIE